MFFVGWPRVGWIVLVALVLPLAGYMAFTRLFSFGSIHYGINYCAGRAALEMAITIMAVFLLSVGMGCAAIGARCRDAGMEAPRPRSRRWMRWLAAGLATLWCGALVWYAFNWERDGVRNQVGFWLSFTLVLLVFGVIFLRNIRLRRASAEETELRMTVTRSLIPILAACFLAVGLVARLHLVSAERGQIRKLAVPGKRIFLDNLRMCKAADYREFLRSLPEKGALSAPRRLNGE